MDFFDNGEPVPRPEYFRPVRATCSISAFENKIIGLAPYASFRVYIECAPLTVVEPEAVAHLEESIPAGDERDDVIFYEAIELELSWTFPKRMSWRSVYDLDVVDVPCFMELGGSEASVTFNGRDLCMGRLSLKVLSHDGATLRLRATLSEDIDGLGLEEFGVEFDAEFKGVQAPMFFIEEGGRVDELVDLDGLVQLAPNRWVPPSVAAGA